MHLRYKDAAATGGTASFDIPLLNNNINIAVVKNASTNAVVGIQFLELIDGVVVKLQDTASIANVAWSVDTAASPDALVFTNSAATAYKVAVTPLMVGPS